MNGFILENSVMTVVTGLFLGGLLVLITDFWNSSREQAAIAHQKKTDGADGDAKEDNADEPQPDVIPEKARRRVRKDD